MPELTRTKVVNLKKAHFTRYIGRPGKGQDGFFGNPVERGRPCPECGKKHWNNDSIVQCYEVLIIKRLEIDAEFRRRVQQLHGEVLGCFCKPQSCHGDILAKFADYLTKNNGEFNPKHFS